MRWIGLMMLVAGCVGDDEDGQEESRFGSCEAMIDELEDALVGCWRGTSLADNEPEDWITPRDVCWACEEPRATPDAHRCDNWGVWDRQFAADVCGTDLCACESE